MNFKNFFLLLFISLIALFNILAYASSIEILNVSYDPTRELYENYNPIFAQHWETKTGQTVLIQQSHGASGAQARAVIGGLDADVVTLALAYDIDIIAEKTKFLPLNWQERLPNHSCPYTSTIVFLVRKGNPKQIKDWSDLIRPDVRVIIPNPKTSGGARWSYMAAWGYALKKNKGNEELAKAFMVKLFKNVPVFDAAARGSTNTFVQRGIGDVLLAWENEAFLVIDKFETDQFEIVLPSISILAEPPVALIDHNANKKGSTAVSQAYLEYLYSPEAQELIAQHYYRPYNTKVALKYQNKFPKLKLFTIRELGDWKIVQAKHFNDGGFFDQIYH